MYKAQSKMKKPLLLLFTVVIAALLFSLANISAQTNVQLQINHKLGGEPFAFDSPSENNLGQLFSVYRMQYYISDITLIYDGGTETLLEDYWLLVNAGDSEVLNVDLGNFALTNAEAIRFSIGVGPAYNNEDPSVYPMGHPLALHSPSMHWGWASGYRFIAFEGNAGPALNQIIELHGLGNSNYFATEIPLTNATASGGALTINLDADYARVLENMEISTGVNVHGDAGEARDALLNMRDYVFTQVQSTITSSNEIAQTIGFDLYPNPSNTTVVKLSFSQTVAGSNFSIQINDISGRQVSNIAVAPGQNTITLPELAQGYYFVSLQQNNKVVATKKMVVQ